MEDVLGDEQTSCNRKLQLGNRFYQSQQLITTTKTSKMTTMMMTIFAAVAIIFILPLQTQGTEIMQTQTQFENNDNVIVDNTESHTETILNEINEVPEVKNLPQDADMEDLEESIRNSVKTEIEMEKNTSTSALLNVINSIPEADLRETLTQDILSTDYIPKNQNPNEKHEGSQQETVNEQKEIVTTAERETLATELADEPEDIARESRNLITADKEDISDINADVLPEAYTRRNDVLIETSDVDAVKEEKEVTKEEVNEQKPNIDMAEAGNNEVQNKPIVTNAIQNHKNEILNSLEAVHLNELSDELESAHNVNNIIASDSDNDNTIKTIEIEDDDVVQSVEVDKKENVLESTIKENDSIIVNSTEEEKRSNVIESDEVEEKQKETNIVDSVEKDNHENVMDSKEEVQEKENNVIKAHETSTDETQHAESIKAIEIESNADIGKNLDEDKDIDPVNVSENIENDIEESIHDLSEEEKTSHKVSENINNLNEKYEVITQTTPANDKENNSDEIMTVVLKETLTTNDESGDTSEIHLSDLEKPESDDNINSTVEQSKHNIIKKPGVEAVTNDIQPDEVTTVLPDTNAIQSEDEETHKQVVEETNMREEASNENQEGGKSEAVESIEENVTPVGVEIPPFVVDEPTLDSSNTARPQIEEQEKDNENIEISNEMEAKVKTEDINIEDPVAIENEDGTVSVGSTTIASVADQNTELHTVEVNTEILPPSTKGSRSIYTANNGVEDSASALFDADHLYNNNLAAENSADIDKALLTRNVHDDSSHRSAIIIVICSSTAFLFIVISVTIFLISFQRQHGTLDIEMQEQRCGKDDLDEEDAETHTKLLEVEVPSTVTMSTEETDELKLIFSH
ncbi:putative leucine-rich repeat-containing protein DDB_G0290503 isoform X1 [Teleopsis dalmanni]|uniref:putative leucine-rich repeat-containing protein DDB_G0290503 isoform X1 n=1 Tax=Teleopsis dalmanni TaxID=139649 RepID=UPI0018CE9368|nr:putative leucine-rich repeat-containing protein DDB_G0290503 isoform X1 [Teleopsis dalmanni]XP_037950333.1 putative leucine-rich repeat-containing protein DDB_G0290503 isoform X1 [Teleopsis dalmanni]